VLISDLAERTGVSARALRHYEDTGLMHPDRDTNGYRVFTEDDVGRVAQIKTMIGAGMSAELIRRYIDCISGGHHGAALDMCPDLRAELEILAVRLSQQHREIQETRGNLRALVGE